MDSESYEDEDQSSSAAQRAIKRSNDNRIKVGNDNEYVA